MPQDKPEYREEIRKIDEQITALHSNLHQT